ncbi:metallophosphoesterase [Candidatus Chloroploca asiatica]|uniref:Uncharacterized protein n=1 Tax=Candidatus Chloroploca asiatica TaxID=1506545 RepID=A0A2H3KHX3_9CHLR|nr:metallophosphoesterase [Candidatus Chloroploca asiatica]PDV97404.1 hypothetical protein A9Q02_18575 [Candidatus Chloroploca asiatica]
MEHVVYVISDLHLGPGWLPDGRTDPLEDFTSDEALIHFIDHIGTQGHLIELVIAGDFLEFCQTLPEIGLASPEDSLGSTESESLRRARVILGYEPQLASGHPQVFAALRRFMMEGHSITIIAGNHDIDLLWKKVWALVFDTIYPPGAWGDLRLVNYSHTVGDGAQGRVFIEHGHEYDRANRFGDMMSRPFGVDNLGMQRLKRCWGTLFVDKVFNQLERERWFIDNVKPIMRVIQLGLRNDFIFTATAIALVVRFLMVSGLPPLILGGIEESEATPPDLDALADAIADPSLQAAVRAHLADPTARAEFERVIDEADPTQLAMVAYSELASMSLEEVTTEPDDEIVVLGGGRSEDAYRRAARAIVMADPTVATVLMGHTHTAIDGHAHPISLPDGRQCAYFNSGTWTRHLIDDGSQSYSWQEIGDENNYTTLFSYIKLDPDGKGGYVPSLHSWFHEEQA